MWVQLLALSSKAKDGKKDYSRLHKSGGAWMAQSVKRPTLGFRSGHDLEVHGIKPCFRLCADSVEPAWDSPPHCLCPFPASLITRERKQGPSGNFRVRTEARGLGPSPSFPFQSHPLYPPSPSWASLLVWLSLWSLWWLEL